MIGPRSHPAQEVKGLTMHRVSISLLVARGAGNPELDPLTQ